MTFNYDIKNKESIISYAKNLEGKSISEKFRVGELNQKYEAKGYFGQLVERIYFGIENNSRPEPDFIDANLELKTSPLKLIAKNKYVSKERLVLGIINYFDITKQEFESSDFWKKNSNLLLIFYLFEKEKLPFDYVVKIVGEWNFASDDFEIIKKDWNHIKQKVLDGKAHELSEGQTYYLGACTKGANSESLRNQPYSSLSAMQRAFSFKQGYVNHIIAKLANRSNLASAEQYGKLIQPADDIKNQSIDDIIKSRFKPYLGMNVHSIFSILGLDIKTSSKSKWAEMTQAIMKVELGKRIEEFDKAEITTRTVRLSSKNMPKEAISFPAFKYLDFMESDWESSDFKSQIEKRFFFVFLKENEGELILDSIKFWSMPYNDIEKCSLAWLQVKELITQGELIKELSSAGKRLSFFSQINNEVTHVRPHASNAEDCYPLPVPDVLTGASAYTKHSFWLNQSYVKKTIYENS